jgi:iron only hydrogenase large subunit-like protein
MNSITTSKARCRDCYKCIRQCPVKAIGLNDGQAWVDEDRCILCGRCIDACPQKAKSMKSQLPEVERFLAAGEKIIFSLAPSYLAATTLSSPWKLVAALKQLGRVIVEETAIGAEPIAAEYYRRVTVGQPTPLISSCCPVVVNLIEKYYPQLVPCFAGIISPMAAHGKLIKAKRGPLVKVVFVGPCYGKKAEPDWEAATNPIDAVLTFEELEQWFKEKGIDPESLTDCQPDCGSANAGLFPLQQGVLKSAGLADGLEQHIISVSGIDQCTETFRDLAAGLIKPVFIEAMACPGGCIGGPAMSNTLGINARRERLFHFAQTPAQRGGTTGYPQVSLGKKHQPAGHNEQLPTEEQIRAVLRLTGKNTPEDEANCGGCGYPSCREKALAVLRGMAEPEMCIPYMRQKAESFANAIVDTTLNAIIVVDQNMVIQEFNPTADRLFNRKQVPAKGKPLRAFVDPADFIKVWEKQEVLVDQLRTYEQYNSLVTRQIIYPLPKYGVIIGIINDVTAEEARKVKYENMRHAALDRAGRVVREQMRVVQNVAGLLGESTAETKATLMELIEIMEEGEASRDEV